MALHPTFSKYNAGYWFSRANRSATAVAPNRGSTGSDTRLISPGRAVIRSLRNERRSLGIEVWERSYRVGRVSFTLLGSGCSWFVFMFGSAFTFRFTFDRGPDRRRQSRRYATRHAGRRPEP